MTPWAATEGLAFPLGVSRCANDDAYNFALYSKHATTVRLLLFADDDLETPRVELALDPLINKSGRVWHCRVAMSAVGNCRYYGYRIDGPEPSEPFEAHAFHPEKLLLDPYARCIAFPLAFDRGAALDELPNFGKAPLGMIEACEMTFDWGADRRPHHDGEAVIYELHVRGFTQHASSGASARARGTFAGVTNTNATRRTGTTTATAPRRTGAPTADGKATSMCLRTCSLSASARQRT